MGQIKLLLRGFSDDGSSSVFEWRRALDVEGGGVFGRGCCHGDGFERAGRHHKPTPYPTTQKPVASQTPPAMILAQVRPAQ